MAKDQTLLTAAGRIADGDVVDWASISSSMPTPEDREIADELALVAQIAEGHRQLHQILPVAADTPANLVPDRARWGHLDLLNVVGRGSYGIVYRAWDTRLERLVALKLFHGAANPDEVMQEGRMLARMRHENVVSVYGADVIDGVAGIWMELVHGRTLENIVKGDGPLPAREAAAAGADVARALVAVHGAGLLHCDVKAQNVVRENGGRVVLMDLGAGRLVPEHRDIDAMTDIAGTPRYMAPELFRPGTSATRASDIYGLGVLLYFTVSGRFPVDGKTLSELRYAHQINKVRPLGEAANGVPKRLIEIVTKAIDPDPGRRPESVQEILTVLQSLAAEPAPSPIRAFPWSATVPTLALLAALVVWLFRSPGPVTTVPEPNTLAVLPIANLTGDPSAQYLADGLTEVLIAHLAQLSRLQVASSAATAGVRDMRDERAIADTLGVRLLLSGAVVRADDRIALSVKLTDPRAGRTIWGTELERRPSNVLEARSEIANLVAARLALEAPSRDAARPATPPAAEAQEAFLRGVVEASSASANTRMVQAEQLFARASELEPRWAEPLAYLAYTQQSTTEFGDPSHRAERAEQVRGNALRAIQLDPELPLSYTALAAVQAYHDWDFRGAEATLRQGLTAHARDGTARARLSLLLAAMGRLDEAVREAERARDDESMLPDRHANLAVVRYYARDFERSLADYDKALSLAPDFVPALVGRGRLLLALGRHDDSAASIQKAIAVSPNPALFALLAHINMAANRPAVADELIERLRTFEREGQFVSIDNYAYIEAHRGNVDEAFRLLDEAITRRMTNVVWLAVDPRGDVLRSDPRFRAAVQRMGVLSR